MAEDKQKRKLPGDESDDRLVKKPRENDEQKFAEAKQNFVKAQQEFAKAAYLLGDCYEDGIGVEEDVKKAVQLYTLAAIQGCAPAQCDLGYSYQHGIGIERDAKKAVEWYTLAAQQGHAPAQSNLGACYEGGIGVEKDELKALELYALAGAQGNRIAQQNEVLLGAQRARDLPEEDSSEEEREEQRPPSNFEPRIWSNNQNVDRSGEHPFSDPAPVAPSLNVPRPPGNG